MLDRVTVYLREQVEDPYTFCSSGEVCYTDKDSLLGTCNQIEVKKDEAEFYHNDQGIRRNMYPNSYTLIIDQLKINQFSDYVLIDLKKPKVRAARKKRIGIATKNKRKNVKPHLFKPQYPLNATNKRSRYKNVSRSEYMA